MLRYRVSHGNRIYRITMDLLGNVISRSYTIVNGVRLEGLKEDTLEALYFNSTNEEIY